MRGKNVGRRLAAGLAGLPMLLAATLMAAPLLVGPLMVGPAQAASPVTIALPGVPSIIGTLVFFVARDEGFFKKQGVDVSLRPFDNGTAAAQAVATGSFDLSLSPTPGVIRMVANAGVPLVAVWGMEVPDWQLATVEPGVTSCKQIKGQPVGVDAIGGARAVALQAFLHACGLTLADVQQVPLGSNVGPAMAAGQVTWGTLHLDDVDTLDAQLGGKKLTIVSTYDKVDPVTHYLMLVTTKDRLAAKQAAFAQVVAALEDAAAWMQKPENLPKLAQIGSVTGHPVDIMMKAVPRFLAIHYWPVDSSGLDRANVDRALDIEKTAGGLKPGKTVPEFDQFVTLSVWDAAKGLIGKGG